MNLAPVWSNVPGPQSITNLLRHHSAGVTTVCIAPSVPRHTKRQSYGLYWCAVMPHSAHEEAEIHGDNRTDCKTTVYNIGIEESCHYNVMIWCFVFVSHSIRVVKIFLNSRVIQGTIAAA